MKEMPVGIYLFEIDKSFGPHVLVDYYLTNDKVEPEILKKLSDKHSKNLLDATLQKGELKFYSSKIQGGASDNLFLGFVLKEGEDLMSLKSLFEKIEQDLINNYTKDKKQMQNFLKKTLTSILSLMEKLKEPQIIIDKINERTKQLLDDGKLQEARDLIKLIDTDKIPEKLAAEIKNAEQSMKSKNYKKARKNYLNASALASKIKEEELVSFLESKAEKIGRFPEFIKERESLNSEIKKILEKLEVRHLSMVYNKVIPLLEQDIKCSNNLEDNDFIDHLEKLKNVCFKALKKADEIVEFYKEIQDLVKKI